MYNYMPTAMPFNGTTGGLTVWPDKNQCILETLKSKLRRHVAKDTKYLKNTEFQKRH